MKKALLLFAICGILFAHAQETKRVLFLGNSYTYYNNLPQLVADIAASKGDSLFFDSNMPGGYSLQGHSTNAISQAKMAQGGWDYVVLQEQSQRPSLPFAQFMAASYPYAAALCATVRQADSCTIPLFYMTWGRKNGDQSNCASNPPVCTYAGMQHLLRDRYVLMADSNNAEAAPVGAVWREIRTSNPNIELYNADESHPSLEGSYLAACTFYASIFHKSPVGAAVPPTMSILDAQAIQNQAALTVFDSLHVWMIDTLKPHASFVASLLGPNPNNTACEFVFDAIDAQPADSVFWDFGDGTTGTGTTISHLFYISGTFNVLCEVWKNCKVDSAFQAVLTNCFFGVEETSLHGITIYPNPTTNKLRVQQFEQDAQNAGFKIYDLSGKLLLKGDDASEIDVQNLPKGFYILEIEIDKKVSRQQFVKN